MRRARASTGRAISPAIAPAAFVPLAALPLTPNRKVDRKALPEPEWKAPAELHVAPRNATEEVLADIWREVLKRGEVGIHASFFDLGGDSILSIQILSRASRAGLRLTARQVFDHPTIAGLAAVAEIAREEPEPAATGPAAGLEAAGEFPLAGLDRLDRLDPETRERVLAAESPLEDVYPATPLQQGTLFHTLRSPESGLTSSSSA